MSSRAFAIISSLIFCMLFSPMGIAQTDYKELKYPELPEIKIPDIERVVLPNGMIVYLVEDHELPLISASARIAVSSIDEPGDKVGLAAVTGAVMRTGGTKTRPGDQIDEELESIAASVETSIGLNAGFAGMSVLKENVDTGLQILADILMNPAFPEDKIQLQKIQQKTVISRRNDNVNGIAFREFNKIIYGAQSVYARQAEYSTVDAITREDLVAFHKKYFYPNNVMLGVWGDFETSDMVRRIEKAFGSWAKGPQQKPRKPEINYQYDSAVYFIPKEDVNQSTILIGHIGGLMNDPDYFALQVLSDILSGGFSGRLFRNVRSTQGLAYSVFGAYSANFDYPGQFYVGAITKGESTVKAVRSLQNEIQRIKTGDVTDDELALAKDSFLNSFVFNFDDRGELINRLMTYEYYGYPKDFLEKTKENVEKVTNEDIQRVAQKHLQPNKVRILVVGPEKTFDQPLSTLGKVQQIDITIPGTPMASSPGQ